MTADEDSAELFHPLIAQATAQLEDAATLASIHQAGVVPASLKALVDLIDTAMKLTLAAQTIVDPPAR